MSMGEMMIFMMIFHVLIILAFFKAGLWTNKRAVVVCFALWGGTVGASVDYMKTEEVKEAMKEIRLTCQATAARVTVEGWAERMFPSDETFFGRVFYGRDNTKQSWQQEQLEKKLAESARMAAEALPLRAYFGRELQQEQLEKQLAESTVFSTAVEMWDMVSHWTCGLHGTLLGRFEMITEACVLLGNVLFSFACYVVACLVWCIAENLWWIADHVAP